MILLNSFYLLFNIFSGIANSSEPKTSIQNAEQLKHGERLVLASCGPCHLGDDGLLSGKQMMDVPKFVGTIYSSNITNDGVNGIGNWSEESLRKYIRTAVGPSGRKANFLMPRYNKMGDADLDAIVAYLKAGNGYVSASSEKIPKSKLKLPAKMAPVIKKINVDYPKQPLPVPDSLQHVAYGKYLVQDVLHCYSCHSASPAGVNFKHIEKSKGYLGGGTKFPPVDDTRVVSLNLTFDKETGIGNYTKEDFIKVMKSGQRKNGEWLRFPMPSYSMLTENDLSAIYAYLGTVPKIHNKKFASK